MKLLVIAIFVGVVLFLIYRSKKNIDPAEQACAKEIGSLLNSDPDADTRTIADIFARHDIDQSRCSRVGAMVMPQLRKNGMKPEDARIAMIQVKKAYSLVP
ncbi:hypothetical protein [Marinobacter pelagius]|uniref:Uncharacterized protein n=1 Tax=Marinobacter pelagius TaxID=379482 RepID=A0A1I4RF51_9GAMM|nr:hypothetical protein [Marinobacter pelagius]SFM50570.1 hypothetical protein SAMN04487961_0508 [Marinobacter pelagius]